MKSFKTITRWLWRFCIESPQIVKTNIISFSNPQTNFFDALSMKLKKGLLSMKSFATSTKKSENLFCNKSLFSDYLHKLIREKGLLEPDVYKRAGISKQTWSNLYSGKTCANFLNARKLVVGLKCSLSEAVELLAYCGMTFATGNYYDDCIKECLKNHIFNFVDVEIYMYGKQEKLKDNRKIA